MDTKMRIKLFTEDERLLSDRLVEQVTEFRVGPKDKHKGPICLEVNLRNTTDANEVIAYINKLCLDLPLESKIKTPKVNKALKDMLSDDQPILDLKNQALTKKNQEELVEFLRQQYDFRFVHSQLLMDMNEDKPGMFEVRERDQDWQFFIRLEKEAKNPLNDKWDTRLAFGIKILGDRVDQIKVYFWGKFEKSVKMEWADKKKINFKRKEKIMVFPAFMNLDERKKWRVEHRKLITNPELKHSTMYDRWAPHISLP